MVLVEGAHSHHPVQPRGAGPGEEYAGQTNPMHIKPADEAKVRPYLKGGMPVVDLWSIAGVDELLIAIRNYDRVLRLSPRRPSLVREHERRVPDAWLPDTLKRLYNHRCQICVHDFEPRYGITYADTRRLRELKAGAPVSTDLAVLCPNHSAVIGATDAVFDRRNLEFRYPNGLVEKVTLRDHLLLAS